MFDRQLLPRWLRVTHRRIAEHAYRKADILPDVRTVDDSSTLLQYQERNPSLIQDAYCDKSAKSILQ